MCFDDDSHPPMPLSDNSGAHGEETTFTASDGTTVLGYLAEPAEEAPSQVVILPDVRGLHARAWADRRHCLLRLAQPDDGRCDARARLRSGDPGSGARPLRRRRPGDPYRAGA